MSTVSPNGYFCMTGNHTFEAGVQWKMSRASKINGRWVQDPSSRVSIICCVEHPLPPQV